MRITIALVLVLFLVSCVPVPEPEKVPELKETQEAEPARQEATDNYVEPAAFVTQTFHGGSTASYGFDASGQLITIEGSKNTLLTYDDSGNLISVNDIKLEYEDGLLKKASGSDETASFEYTSGRLAKMTKKNEYLTFTYDAAGTLTDVTKNANPPVSLRYDDKNNIKEIQKAGSVFKLYYDDKGKLKDIDMDDNHIIIGRGKESRLVSLTGQFYGQGEMFDYMDDMIKVISSSSSEFTGPDDLRMKAFNLYLICTRIKQLDVAFDAVPYAIVRNYFGMDVYDYVVNNYFCGAFR